MRVRFAHWIPRRLKVEGIVLYPYILFSQPMSEVSPHILQHEFIHVRQVRAKGPLHFYASYGWQYFREIRQTRHHDTAYRKISFEQEAYAGQETAVLSAAEEAELGLTIAHGPHGKRAVVKALEGKTWRA